MNTQEIKVALLDLYNDFPNQGMGNIRSILKNYRPETQAQLTVQEFDVRGKNEVPDTSFQIYISSGGPGSPFDGVDLEWEQKYFQLLDDLIAHNKTAAPEDRKFVFFICHSFQLAARYFGTGTVTKRHSTSFGVFPVHLTEEGHSELVFSGLQDPFYAVDSRDWQVIAADTEQLKKKNVQLLAIEKERPHIAFERAIMALRFNAEMIGTQFHPEADAHGMRQHLIVPERKEQVVKAHGLAKYESMMEQLEDPDKILLTQSIVLPSFLDMAVQAGVLAE